MKMERRLWAQGPDPEHDLLFSWQVMKESRKLRRIGWTGVVRACMSRKALMSDHRSRPGGRCVPRTPLPVILFEERPPALNVDAEEYPRARKEPAYKPGRR